MIVKLTKKKMKLSEKKIIQSSHTLTLASLFQHWIYTPVWLKDEKLQNLFLLHIYAIYIVLLFANYM